MLSSSLGVGRTIRRRLSICKNSHAKTSYILAAHFAQMVKILKTRSSTDIIGLILQAVESEPLTRSKIMYEAMLNFVQVNHYTALLVREGLLQYQTLEKRYAINDKGRKFLALFNESNRLLTTSDKRGYDFANMQFAGPEPSSSSSITSPYGATGGGIT